MKWNEIVVEEKCALLQSKNDTQYAVVSGYDPTAPEDQQWDHGEYFMYWPAAERKAECLQSALDYFLKWTKETEKKEPFVAVDGYDASATSLLHERFVQRYVKETDGHMLSDHKSLLIWWNICGVVMRDGYEAAEEYVDNLKIE